MVGYLLKVDFLQYIQRWYNGISNTYAIVWSTDAVHSQGILTEGEGSVQLTPYPNLFRAGTFHTEIFLQNNLT